MLVRTRRRKITEMKKDIDEMTMKKCRGRVAFSISSSGIYGVLGFDVDAPSEAA
jgi:hypothetical protein